jgi:hypothetical protein
MKIPEEKPALHIMKVKEPKTIASEKYEIPKRYAGRLMR